PLPSLRPDGPHPVPLLRRQVRREEGRTIRCRSSGARVVHRGSAHVMKLSSTARLTIDRITDRGTFMTLREEWRELLAASGADCIFLTWEWLYAWWNHLAAGRQLRLITVRAEGRLVGLLPLSVSPPHWRRLIPFRRCEFLGAGSVGSDYL